MITPMISSIHQELLALPTQAPRQSLLLFDDLTAADEGVALAFQLSSEAGLDIGCPDMLASVDTLDVPRTASQISRQAVASSDIILSLSGNGGLSVPQKRWIEEWLGQEHSESEALIVLLDPDRGSPGVLSATRRWLQRAVAGTSVNLFFFTIQERVGADTSASFENVAHDAHDSDEWFIGATCN